MIFTADYPVTQQAKQKPLSYEDITPQFNKTYTYCFPMLGANKSNFTNLRACFIGDEEKPQYDNHIFLLHKSLSDPASLKYENNLMQHTTLTDVYYPDNHCIMLVFSIPDILRNDYRLFRKSKFSRMSQEYKAQIIKFHAPYEKNIREMLFYRVLMREDKLKRQLEDSLGVSVSPGAELSSCLDMDIEVFHPWMKLPD